MRYVNDLTAVKPEEIIDPNYASPIQAIILLKDTSLFGELPILVVFENGTTGRYTRDGRAGKTDKQYFIFKPVKHERWGNVYRYIKGDGFYISSLYDTEEEARNRAKEHPGYITTTKIEWED